MQGEEGMQITRKIKQKKRRAGHRALKPLSLKGGGEGRKLVIPIDW